VEISISSSCSRFDDYDNVSTSHIPYNFISPRDRGQEKGGGTYTGVRNLGQIDLIREMPVRDAIFLSIPPSPTTTTTTTTGIIDFDEDLIGPLPRALNTDANSPIERETRTQDVEVRDAGLDDSPLHYYRLCGSGCGSDSAGGLGGGDAYPRTVFRVQIGADGGGEGGLAGGGEGVEGVCLAGVGVEHGGSGWLLGFGAEGVEVGIEGLVLFL
jgi:hypothetical protein